MGRKARRIIGLAIALALASILAVGGVFPQVTPALASSTTNAEVSINTPDKVTPDSDFTATVNISQVENFDASNYDVSFDPTVLRLNNVTNGQIDSTEIPVDIWNERSPGTYIIIQNVPGLTGATGSGHLAVLHFHVIGSIGQGSDINLSNGILSNTLAQEISAAWTGGLVNINSVESSGQGSPPAPPEPGTEEVSAEEVSAAAPTSEAPAPPPPPAQPKPVNWPVLWGVIGGVVTVIVVGLIIFSVRRRAY